MRRSLFRTAIATCVCKVKANTTLRTVNRWQIWDVGRRNEMSAAISFHICHAKLRLRQDGKFKVSKRKSEECKDLISSRLPLAVLDVKWCLYLPIAHFSLLNENDESMYQTSVAFVCSNHLWGACRSKESSWSQVKPRTWRTWSLGRACREGWSNIRTTSPPQLDLWTVTVTWTSSSARCPMLAASLSSASATRALFRTATRGVWQCSVILLPSIL